MGHIYHRHNARTNAESVRNEQQADQFAARVMQRTPLPPLGVLIFFMADAGWSGFSGSDRHPLSGKRVRALADHVDTRGLASQLREFGKLLEDPNIRVGFVATGKAGDLAALSPRRPGVLPRRDTPLTRSRPAALFDGRYRGELVQLPEPDPLRLAVFLERHGDRVEGYYAFGLGLGTLEGKVVDGKLYFD